MSERTTLGLIAEIVILGNNNLRKKVIARIDTGATNSSIDVRIAEELELGPIKKTRLVKSASGRGRRGVVAIKVRLDNKLLEDEFTIAQREHMTYPVLIGQNILKKGNFLVDPNME